MESESPDIVNGLLGRYGSSIGSTLNYRSSKLVSVFSPLA
jgi:hypothetical protein